MKFQIWIILSIAFLVGCSSETTKTKEPKISALKNEIKIDSTVFDQKLKPEGIELFIDSMKTVNYLLDTNRIKQTIWSFIFKYPTTVDNGHQIIQLPFPVEKYSKHFTNPKTYFFAHWNEIKKTFENGNDYLLMTWNIDSAGIKKEKEIYTSLHLFMGNFPCYIFRSEKTVYAMSHRMTVAATETRKLTEQLRNYIDTNATIYKPFDGVEPR